MTRRNGIIRAGPDERLRTERERQRQRECRNRKRTAAALHKRVVQEDIRERENSSSFGARLNQRLVRRDAKVIIDVVSETLNKSTDMLHQEAVLQAVWSDGLAAVVFLESRRLAAQV